MNEYSIELQRAIRGRAVCILFIVFGVIFYLFSISLNIYLNNKAKVEKKRADIAMTKLIGENLALLDFLNNKKFSIQVNEVQLELSALEGVLSAFNSEQEKSLEKKEQSTKGQLFTSIKSFVKTSDLTILSLSYLSLTVIFLTLFGIYDRRVKNILSYMSSEQRFERINNLLVNREDDDGVREMMNELYSSYISNRIFDKESYTVKPNLHKMWTLAGRHNNATQR